MNITHVVPYMHPHAGGPPVVVDRLCRRLAARGHTVRVLTTDAASGGEVGWEQAYAGGDYELEVHRATGGAFAYSRTLAAAVRSAVAHSDVVHLHTLWTYPTLRAAWACQRAGVPYLVMPHGMLDPASVRRKQLKKWLYVHLFEGPSLRRAAGMVFTHPEEERLARQTVGGLPYGWVVPLGADEPPAGRAELAEEFFAEHPNYLGTRIVLFLGRLHPKKGLDLLLPTFAELNRLVPESRLVLVGPGDEDYVNQLRRVAASGGMDERVAFLGPLAGRKKWAAYAAATVFALPSYQENFALTVVEAMSVGTLVALSRNVNIWGEVENAGGRVIFPLDTNGVLATLLPIVRDADLAEKIGRSGQEFCRQRYNWERTADATETAYRSVLSHATTLSGGTVRNSPPTGARSELTE